MSAVMRFSQSHWSTYELWFVVEEVVLPHRAHVGADTLPHVAVELLERHPLPLGGGLHHLAFHALVEPEATREVDGRREPSRSR